MVVGDGSDVGGGASIMGTLSGGGKEVIGIGEGCLLGANAGIGIPPRRRLRRRGRPLRHGRHQGAPSWVGEEAAVVKAGELSGRSGLLFRRNSRTGAVEVLARTGTSGAVS